MKISQEAAILIINLCQRGMVHEGCWVNFSTTVGNMQMLEASTVCWTEATRLVQCPATRQWQTAYTTHSGRGPRVQLGGQAKKVPISSWDFAWNWHSPFKCAQDNSPLFSAQMRQTTSCSAVVWTFQSLKPIVMPFSFPDKPPYHLQ